MRLTVLRLVLYLCSAALAAGQSSPIRSTEVPLFPVEEFATQKGVIVDSAGATLAPGMLHGTAHTPSFAAPHPFSAAVVRWEASVGGNGDLVVELRTSSDGTAWGGWHRASPDHDREQECCGAAVETSLIITEANARFGELRVSLSRHANEAAPVLRSLSCRFIDPGEMPPIPRMAEPQIRAGGVFPKPAVVSRTSWGCPEGQSSPRWTPRTTTVTHLIVHHTVNGNSSSNWAAVVRAIWDYHANAASHEWGDIGYNYLIDPAGVIYEGRAGGDNVIGAHFSCANGGTMGVAMLGTFTSTTPSTAALASLKKLMAWKAAQREIDPESSGYHSASKLTLNNISGHRDGNSMPDGVGCASGTVCPGTALHGLLPSIRRDVAALIDSESTPLPATETLTAINVSSNSAVIRGRIKNDGGSPIIDRRFDWGSSTPLSQAVFSNAIGVSGAEFTATLTGLSPGTTYQFRAWARNGSAEAAHGLPAGWSTGSILSFTTAPVETYTLGNVSASPASIEPGQTTSLSWSVTSNVARTVLLGATLMLPDNQSGAVADSDTSHDVAANLVAGTRRVSRSFTAPQETAPGTYDALVSIWADNNGNGRIDSLVDQELGSVRASSAVNVKSPPPVTFTVTPTAGSHGAISPAAPQTVTSGEDISFAAVPEQGFAVDRWIVNGTEAQIGGQTFHLFAVIADATIHVSFKLAPPQDEEPPSLEVTEPADGAIDTRSAITVRGTASDAGRGSSGITSVTVNGAVVAGAGSGGDAIVSWSAEAVPLQEGENILVFIARDGAGNETRRELRVIRSTLPEPAPGTLSLTHESSSDVLESSGAVAFLIQRLDGHDGRVTIEFTATTESAQAGIDFTPVRSTVVFEAGETWKRVAVAVLDDGTFEGDEAFNVTLSSPAGGAVLGAVSSLRVRIVDDERFEFAPIAGRFHGLLVAADGLADGESGRWKLTLREGGRFTGALRTATRHYAFRGSFDEQGVARAEIRLITAPIGMLELQLRREDGRTMVSGSFLSATGTSTVVGARLSARARGESVPHRGRHTAFLSPTATGDPFGEGFASVHVRRSGAARIAGRLPEGTPFTAGSWISENHSLALFTLLPRGGRLLGELQFPDSIRPRGITGAVDVFLSPQSPAIRFSVSGGVYVPPRPGERILPQFADTSPNAQLIIGGGEPYSFTVSRAHRASPSLARGPSLRFNLKTGTFFGRTLAGVIFHGAVLQEEGRSTGVARVDGIPTLVVLRPTPP